MLRLETTPYLRCRREWQSEYTRHIVMFPPFLSWQIHSPHRQVHWSGQQLIRVLALYLTTEGRLKAGPPDLNIVHTLIKINNQWICNVMRTQSWNIWQGSLSLHLHEALITSSYVWDNCNWCTLVLIHHYLRWSSDDLSDHHRDTSNPYKLLFVLFMFSGKQKSVI